MISINGLSVQFTGEYIFEDVSFIINPRDRIGLVGKNGAGKTTLLKILAGIITPEKGNVSYPSGTTIGYLPQEITTVNNTTVIDEALKAFSHIHKLEKKIQKITDEIANATDYHSSSYISKIEQLHHYNEQIRIWGKDTMMADTEKVLLGLGFEYEDFHRSLKEFSGGWQMRVEIAKLLLMRPSLLLLDEPTNHLDIESLQWMEEFLETYQGAVVVVSHDRAFLDNITTRTIEISLGKLYDYNAPYSEYVRMRNERYQSQIATYNNQQRQIAQIERFIERFRYKATKAKQVQSRIKMLEKMERVEIDDQDDSVIHFLFPPAPPSGKVVLEISNASKSYGEKKVLENINLTLTRGEKIAFVGRNGEGKTTLVKMLLHLIEFSGTVKHGHNVIPAYYAQNQTELLDEEKTVFQTIDEVAVGDMRAKVRNLLGSFLFSGDTIEKKVKVLSGGEKARLALAKMLLTPVNLLVMDEPTNHLDMVSKDILKNALLRYDGTLIIVSHDRDFLQGLTQKIYEVKNHSIKEYIGDIQYFLNVRKINSLKELEKKQNKDKKTLKNEVVSENKQQWERKKKYEKEHRRLKSQIIEIEKNIEFLESQIEALNEMFTNPEKYAETVNNNEMFAKYQQLQAELDSKVDLWEKLHYEMEELKKFFSE